MLAKKLTVIIVLTIVSLPSITTSADEKHLQEELDVETMIAKAENRGLSVVYNARGLSLPILFNPLADLITGWTPTTVVKVGVIYSAALYMLAYFFPGTFGVAARKAGLMSARMSMSSPFDFNYDYIQNTLSDATQRLSDFIQIPEPECRYRAVCETATYIATKMPTVNEFAKKVSGAFFLNLANPYSKAWINGMMQIDCATTYDKCYESPFKTIVDKFVAKKK